MKITKVTYLILLASLCSSVSNIVVADETTLGVTRLEVVESWYGVEGETAPKTQEQVLKVLYKLQKSVVNNSISIPADMNGYFGFDPSYGKVKEVSVTINYQGFLTEIRQTEGKALKYPGTPNVDYRQMSRRPLNAGGGSAKAR